MKNNFKFLILLTILLAGCICVGSTFAADASVSDVSDVSSVDNTVINELVHDDSSQKDVEILTNASDIPLNENPNINISVSCSKYSMGNNLYYKVSINDTSYTDDFQTLTRHDSEGFYVYSPNWIGTKRINTVGNYKATINIYKLESNPLGEFYSFVSSQDVNFRVNKLNATVSIKTTNNNYCPVVNVTVIGVDGKAVPSGNVTLFVNGAEVDNKVLTNGKCEFNVTDLVGGNHTIFCLL